MTESINLLAVVGPTGVGKSDLAIHLAKKLNSHGRPAEIINADSMQLYKGMNIGTAKLPEAKRGDIRHHLLDVLEITDESTAAEYQSMVRPLILELQGRGVTPILVGGSMLYVAAALNTFEFPARDEAVRAELEARLTAIGSHAMHAELAQIDPLAASRIDAANGRRVVRAMEIVTITKEPFAAALPEVTQSWQPVLEIGINGPRDVLVERLGERVRKMWQLGLVDEAKSLEPQGIRIGKTSSRAIGYAQALAQLDGVLTQEQAIAETIQLTSRYARRQMSWFRRDERIHWLDFQSETLTLDAEQLIHDYAPHLLGE